PAAGEDREHDQVVEIVVPALLAGGEQALALGVLLIDRPGAIPYPPRPFLALFDRPHVIPVHPADRRAHAVAIAGAQGAQTAVDGALAAALDGASLLAQEPELAVLDHRRSDIRD